MPLFYWFHLFLEARAEILEKKFVFFFWDFKTRKGHFEINWHLDLPINSSWSLSSCFKSSFALFCSCKANSISFSAFCKLCSFSLRSSSRRSAASRRSARFAISSFLSVKVKICQISLFTCQLTHIYNIKLYDKFTFIIPQTLHGIILNFWVRSEQ